MRTYQSKPYVNRIKELRMARGMRVRDLAQAVGVNDAQISKLERGQTALTQAWLYRLADPLKCQPWEILPGWRAVQPETLVEALWRDYDAHERAKLFETLAQNAQLAAANLAFAQDDNEVLKKARLHIEKPEMTEEIEGCKLVEIDISLRLLRAVADGDEGSYTATIYYRPRHSKMRKGQRPASAHDKADFPEPSDT